MKVADNQYLYRLETQTENGSTLDYQEIETIEPLRSVGDIHDEIDLENNKQIKRIEEIVFTGESAEYWYNDDTHTTDTHFVAYTESLDFYCNVDHPYCETNRKEFEFGDVHIDENKNFFCTSVELNGMNRIYISIDKSLLSYTVYSHETLKEYFKENPITVWYVLRYPVEIPRTHAKGYVMTHHNSTTIDVQPQTMGKVIPIVKATIEDSSIEMDSVPTLTISNTEEGNQITDLTFEGVTLVNNAKADNIKGTKEVSHTRYDFAPFYDGQTIINNTIEGGYVSAKLYGDTMINIAKTYGETDLLTMTDDCAIVDLLGDNADGVILADGTITEGRIYGDSVKTTCCNVPYKEGVINEQTGEICNPHVGCHSEKMPIPNRTFIFTTPYPYSKVIYFDLNDTIIKYDWSDTQVKPITSTPPKNASYLIFGADNRGGSTEEITYVYEDNGEAVEEFLTDEIQSVVNPTIISNGIFKYGILDVVNGGVVKDSQEQMYTDFLDVPTRGFCFDTKNSWARLVFYNENKEFIRYSQTGNHNYAKLYVNTSNIPSDAKYIRYGFGGTNLKDTTIKYTDDNTDVYPNLKLIQATFPYTLNKLPNGVVDYIDVVNGVYVQRVGKQVFNGSENWSCPNNLQKDETVVAVLYGQAYGQIYNNGTIASTGLCDKLGMEMGATTKTNIYNPDGTWVLSVLKTELSSSTLEGIKQWLSQKQPTVLGQLKTPIYTPLTEEEKASLPLSAYKDGHIQLSSDELRPSKFEFRAKSSNRMQLDMLETGYYYLDAPVGNVKLGTANVDVQQMPCIIKVDNVGTGDGGYRLSTGDGYYKEVELTVDGYYVNINNGELLVSENRATSDYIYIDYYENLCVENLGNRTYFDMVFYDENKNYISFVSWDTVKNYGKFKAPQNAKYFRVSIVHEGNKIIRMYSPITLSKLPSHRIPTTFTQGMKSSVDFGYWQGIKYAKPYYIYTTDTVEWKVVGDVHLNGGSGIELHSITGKYGTTVTVEDEIDISTGKYTKRVGKYVIDGTVVPYGILEHDEQYNIQKVTFLSSKTGIKPKHQWGDSAYGLAITDSLKFNVNYTLNEPHIFIGGGNITLFFKAGTFGAFTLENVQNYFRKNPMTVYYELETPEITYLDLERNELRTVSNSTNLQVHSLDNSTYLKPQVKSSPLSYPTTLSPNTQYTVFHNRKNYNGSVKTPMINLGGTEVAATGSRTVVTTPSTLAHNELQFIGGENTVEQVMVVHGDWTKEGKTVDYFEGLQSSVIGDKTLENLVDKPVEIWSSNVTNVSNGGAVDYVSMDDILAGYRNRPKLPEVQVDTNIRTYGMTLQNLVESVSISEEDIHYNLTLPYNAKQNTTYTFICDVDLEYADEYVADDKTGIYCGFLNSSGKDWNHKAIDFYSGKQYKGKVAIKVTTITDNSISNKFRVRFYQQNVMTKWSATNFIILEGDYTNIDIPYFEGMKSVENPVLTTTGKNLFDENRRYESSHKLWFAIPFEKDSYFTFSSFDTIPYIEFYGTTTEFIDKLYGGDGISWKALATFSNKESGTFKKESKYNYIIIAFDKANLSNGEDFLKNLQLEQGTQATSYEPYKSSILSAPQGTVLRGVGSYKDMIGWNDGIIRRRCVEFTISGDEGYNWQVGDDLGSTTCFILPLGSIGLSNKIVPGATTVPCACDKIPWQHTIKDYTHLYFNSTKPYSNSLLVCLEKTKLSSVNSQSVNDYIKSIGGLTIVAPLANTEYEDVEITGGGNWNKVVLDGNINWDSANEGDNVNGFSVWKGLGQLFDILTNNDYVKYRLVGQTELKCINYDHINPNMGHFIAFARQVICINVKGCHSLNDVKAWLNEHPIDFWYQMNLEYNSITTNTDPLVFNHGTLYTTTDTHPSTFSDFSLKTTNRYTVKDFDKLKYTVLTEQPFNFNGVDYPASPTGMTIVDITGIADTSIYSDDTMITVVQDDGNYYADGVLTQFKGTKTFTKEFIKTSNGTYDTGMTLLEPLELCGLPNGVKDEYNPTTGEIIKNLHTVILDGTQTYWTTVGRFPNYDYVAFNVSESDGLPKLKYNIAPISNKLTGMLYTVHCNQENVAMIGGSYHIHMIFPKGTVDTTSSSTMQQYFKNLYDNGDPIIITYQLETPQIIQATPTSTYISTRPENGNIIAQDTQIQAEYLNYDNEQSIISPRMLGDGDEIRWEQGSQCYVYENDNEYIPLTEYNELFGANIQAQEYTQYAESVDGTDIELGVALKEKAVYEQTYVKYEDNVVYPETMENIDETNGVEVDYICGATWQNPNDLSDIRHLGELREDGQYDVTIRRSGDDEIRLLEGTTHISLDGDGLNPSEFELTFFNSGGVEVGKYGDTSHMLEDCVIDSKLETGMVYGNTLVNIDVDRNNPTLYGATLENDIVTLTTNYGILYKHKNFKPNTTYTLIITITKTTSTPNDYIYVDGYGNYIPTETVEIPNSVGTHKVLFTTRETFSDTSIRLFKIGKANSLSSSSISFSNNFIILEGDYTSYPMDIPYFEGISSTVVNGFSSCGKNLVDYTQFNYESNSDFTLIDGGYEINFTKPESKIDITIPMKVVQGKTYTIGATIEGNAFFGGLIGNSYYWASPTEAKYTLIATGNADKTILSIKNTETLGKAKVTNIFFYEGDNGVYTPSKGKVYYQLLTPITLRKIGDVCDTFDVVSGKLTQRIGEIVLDGSENWGTLAPGRYCIENTLNNVNRPNVGSINFKCDKLKPITYTEEYSGTLGIALYEKNGYDFVVRTDIPTVEEFKQWLSNNPTTVQYQLATPTTIQHTLIPSTTQTTQEPTFILPQPLRSVPNGICDRLYWDENKGHYCIEKRIGEGTYSLKGYNSNENKTQWYLSKAQIPNLISFNLASTKAILHNNTDGFIQEFKLGANLDMHLNSAKFNNKTEFQQYFEDNPIGLIYPLDISEIIDLPHLNEKVELPTQPDIYPIGYKAVHEKVNPEIGLTIPYKVLNMPTQPVNLNFVMDIADYVLTWDDVKEARQYNIILNDEVIATVKEPQYNTGEEMYGYILVEANNEIGDNLSEELYIKTVPNAPAQLTVAHNPQTDYYDFEISFIDTSDIADYYTVMYKVDGGEWVINTIQNSELTTGERHLWSFSVYEINESIEVWATATNDVGTNDILPSAIYYMSPTPQWTYRINSKDVFLRWLDESPYDTKYKLRYSYKSNGQFQYAYFEGDTAEIGKLYEAVLPLAEDDEVTLALCIISEKENLYCKPVKASKPLDPNIVPPMNFNYHWLARGLIEFYWQDQYNVDVEYEYILESMKANETLWTQVNEIVPSEDVEGTGTIYRVEYQLDDLEQIRMKVRMKWAMNETEWTETLTTVFIPVEGNPPTYIRRTQTAEGLLIEWEAQAYIDSYHIYVIDNETGEELQHLETSDNSILVDLDYSNSIEIAIYEISRFSGGIESDPTDPMVFTPTMFATDIDQRIYRPCAEEYPIEVSTVQKATKQAYVIHDISYTPNVETEHEIGVSIATPFTISYHPMMVDVHQAGSRDEHTINAHIKTLDVRNEDLIRVMTFERTQETYDMNFTVYTPSVASYPINLEVSKVRIVCLGDSLTSGHPFYWAETGTGMIEASYPYQLSRRLKNQYEVINSGYGSDTTDRCLARFDRDVLRYQPQYCIFQCGTNDLYWV